VAQRDGSIWWRSRRGLLELDLLLLPFVEERYARLGPEQQAGYRKLIECEDQDIWAWLQAGRVPGVPDLDEVVRLVVEFNASRARP
jgi:antitoxin CptB